jgi:RNA polymerase sigma factor (TIGR02999 family)
VTGEVTGLLAKLGEGDRQALEAILPLVYDELRRVARNQLRRQPAGQTLQSTALVHEVYLRLAEQTSLKLTNRAHFVAVAARLMRWILVDHVRKRQAAKRGGGCTLTLEEGMALAQERHLDLITLDNALHELSRLDARQGSIVEMRFFGGLSIAETSEVLNISPATVKREWATARAWLQREVGKSEN